MDVKQFNEKINKLDGISYSIEEVVNTENGVYIGFLKHDNINKKSLNVYTGPKLTGEKVENIILSTPSETPWKNSIKIFSNASPVYISYETSGDQVEAEDINNLQDAIVETQQEINNYEQSNDDRVNTVENRVTDIENNKADKDKVFTKEEVLQKINDLINGAPGTLDTLNEIATALGNDPNFAATIINLLGNKVDKAQGESLVVTQEWENVKNEISTAKGGYSSIDERFKNIDSIATQETLYPTTNIGNDYSVDIPNLTSSTLIDGYPLTVKFNAASTGPITLNPTQIGAKNVVDYFGNQVTNVRQGLIANLRYDATLRNFQLLGKGGGGNATAAQILKDATATVNSGPVTGTMTNNGAAIITPGTSNKAIPGGYHNGSGYVVGDANLISGNIKANKSVFGVSGKSSVVDTADALATAAQILSGVSAYVNGNKIIGAIANNYGVWQYSFGITPASGRLHMYPPKGYYDPAGGTGIYYDDVNYVAANIRSGVSIFGLSGSMIDGLKRATLAMTYTGTNNWQYATLQGNPQLIIVDGRTFYSAQDNLLITTSYQTKSVDSTGFFISYLDNAQFVKYTISTKQVGIASYSGATVNFIYYYI